MEADNYARIFSEPSVDEDCLSTELRKLQGFVPHFYGSQALLSQGKKQSCEIMLEDLLGSDLSSTVSFIDVKMGTSTLTLNGEAKGPKFIQDRAIKDCITTTKQLGYTICGFELQDSQGQVVGQGTKMHTEVKNIVGVQQRLRWFFIKGPRG
jgi:hypothetical protein